MKQPKRPYSRRGFPMNLGLQKYVLGKMAISHEISELLPDGWENELDSSLTLPEQFADKMGYICNSYQCTQNHINSDRLNNLELEINMLINKMYCTLVLKD